MSVAVAFGSLRLELTVIPSSLSGSPSLPSLSHLFSRAKSIVHGLLSFGAFCLFALEAKPLITVGLDIEGRYGPPVDPPPLFHFILRLSALHFRSEDVHTSGERALVLVTGVFLRAT